MVGAVFILYSQEVLHTTVFIFAILGTSGAIGGILGGIFAPKVSAALGRVNSVYRFFAWGSIPIGMLIGCGLVTVLAQYFSRESALRAPFLPPPYWVSF